MKKIIVGVLVLFSGCTMAQVETPSTTARAALKTFPTAQAIEQLPLGLSRAEVEEKFDTSVVVGYETETPAASEASAKVKSITIQNPYKTQTIEKKNKRYEVDYYLTHIYQADGVISDDELTPLVFGNGRLVGKGRVFLDKLR